MVSARSLAAAAPHRIRLWPGVVIAVLVVLFRFVFPLIIPAAAGLAVVAGILGAVAFLIWWLFFSRAAWPERMGAVALMILAAAATQLVVHESIATGLMGLMVPIYALPATLVPAFAAWAAAGRRLTGPRRWATMIAAILLACGVWTLLRTEGVTGEGAAQLAWRWTPTPEQRLLAQTATGAALPSAPSSPADARTAGDWPGFRGPARDDVVHGVRIATDWTREPPVELWRRPIGPGWSSFSVADGLVYTQEQRGDHEIVAAYRLTTGEPVWAHRDAARFYESNGGAGPRATPAVHGGRVFAVGATGIVNALDARTGAALWSRDGAADTGAPMPGWGFAGSPLVFEGMVIAALSGRLVAYDADTGERRWLGPAGLGGGYSSPHLVTMQGAPQVLLLRGGGVSSVAPSDGTLLWEHSWMDGVGVLQPALLPGGDLLVTAGDMMGGVGTRRLAVARDSNGWTAEARWTSRGLKPYFNDLVVHDGHAYGFDGSILSCIDVADGERKWKGGRFGNGQLLLLADQDALLVLSEQGELALVSATPDGFTELARLEGIEGKTWNHPVLVGDMLLVRNGEMMAAFRLPLTRRTSR